MKNINNKKTGYGIITLLCISIVISAWNIPASAQNYTCVADPAWVTNPNPPEEIPEGENAQICQFYQFSWQWFLQLMSPADGGNQLRNFEVAARYPILEIDGNGNPVDSCDESAPQQQMFVRLTKSTDTDQAFVLPKRTGQAGGGDTIYDQNSNVVFFNIRFSKNLCEIGAVQSDPNFPPGTMELKSAWRIISDEEKTRYYWIEADIEDVSDPVLLGLIGFHLVRSTALHPEFIWATFEHKDNSPDCTNPRPTPANDWSFASAACASNPSSCIFNKASPNTSLTGTPTEICRVYPYGTAPGDNQAETNLTAITDLNDQLVGPTGFITQLPVTSPLSVFQNYFIVGALWENLVNEPSSVVSNQRGSIRLANTVAETTFQHVDPTAQFVSNCFGCHNYEVESRNTTPAAGLSHIFDDIIKGVCTTPTDVEAGPIMSNVAAQTQCSTTCATKGGWNGEWTTTVPGVMSVCGCCSG